MKQLKHVKKIPFLIVSPILSIIGEVVFIFVLLSLMDSLVFNKRNMASLLMGMVVGAAIWAVYGLIEFLMRKRREMEWYLFGIGAYLIPVVVWVVLTLVSYTYWYSNRLSENAEFFMYLTRTMLLYLVWAAAFRFLGHLVFFFAGGGFRRLRKGKIKNGKKGTPAKGQKGKKAQKSAQSAERKPQTAHGHQEERVKNDENEIEKEAERAAQKAVKEGKRDE